MKGMPASLMTPLCTGAVVSAANSPALQPAIDTSEDEIT